jgi:hypothetical protein
MFCSLFLSTARGRKAAGVVLRVDVRPSTKKRAGGHPLPKK